ncbi:RICIN domain-containing protein [Streptomyces sp. NPDC020719]|uniref:RICIN domain-containing protein n=1 Tax=unclassified Streptomyces TaxID=2593676 RepID=UPI00340898AB
MRILKTAAMTASALALTAGAALSTAGTASATSTNEFVNQNGNHCLAIDMSMEYQVLGILWTCNHNPDQQWRVADYKGSDGGGDYYEIKNGYGQCLGTWEGATDNGTRISGWDCNGNADQQWYIDRVSSDPRYSSIRSHAAYKNNSNKCIGALNGAVDSGTPVILWDCNGHSDQNWMRVG